MALFGKKKKEAAAVTDESEAVEQIDVGSLQVPPDKARQLFERA